MNVNLSDSFVSRHILRLSNLKEEEEEGDAGETNDMIKADSSLRHSENVKVVMVSPRF